MEKKVIIGNWKMNFTKKEAEVFLENLKKSIDSSKCDIGVAVPFTDLEIAKNILDGTHIKVGAQNMHYEDSGAYTGEISGVMLKEIGVDFVIIGHSERRMYFNETDSSVNMKVKKAILNKLNPVICIGETLEERNNNMHFEKIKIQIEHALENVDINFVKDLIIAYEPIWAIGTGITAKINQIEEMLSFIRLVIKEMYDERTSKSIRILYGGSVNENNITELLSMNSTNGALVGGASIKLSFCDLINKIN